jgi:hypothetical protein
VPGILSTFIEPTGGIFSRLTRTGEKMARMRRIEALQAIAET